MIKSSKFEMPLRRCIPLNTVKNRLIGAGMLLVLWYTLHLNAPLIAPSPLVAIKVFFSLSLKGDLLLHLLHSLLRIVGGISLAVFIGYPSGLAAGLSVPVNQIVSSIVYYLHPIPKIAFLPLFMVAFGLGNTSKIILIFSILVFQIFIFTRDGIKDIQEDYFRVALLMKLSPYQTFKKLIFPSTLPRLFSALRISMGISISVLFFAENYATRYGIGYFITNSWSMVNYEHMFAGILAIALLGSLLFWCIDRVERIACPWLYLK